MKLKPLDGSQPCDDDPSASTVGSRESSRGRGACDHAGPALAGLRRHGNTQSGREKRGDITARAIVFRKGDVSVGRRRARFDWLSVGAGGSRACEGEPHSGGSYLDRIDSHAQRSRLLRFPDGKGGHTGDLKYMDSVCDQAAEAVNEAIDRLQPAWIKIATGEAQGKIAYNYYAPDLYDRRMSVIQAVSSAG